MSITVSSHEALAATERTASSPGGYRSVLSVLALAVVVLLTRLPFLTPGHGMDPDASRIANVARSIAHTHAYIASTFPGFPVVEWANSLYWRGGALAMNGMTALLGILGVTCFALLMRRLHSRDWWLAGLALALTPVIYLNSTVTLDYIWAFGFLMAALYAMTCRHSLIAGILLGLAIGCRITSLVFLFPLLLLVDREWRRQWLGYLLPIASALLIGAAAYFPVFRVYGWYFLTNVKDALPPIGEVIRQMLTITWGVLGVLGLTVSLVAAFVYARRQRESTFSEPVPRQMVKVWGFAILLALLLFLYQSAKTGYLVPCIPFVLLLLADALPRRYFQGLCLALIISPFVFAFTPANRTISPSLLTIPTRPALALYLPGNILADHAFRQAQQRYIGRVTAFADNLQRPSVIIASGWMPSLALAAMAHGGTEELSSDAHLIRHLAWHQKYWVRNQNGKVLYTTLLDQTPIRRFNAKGTDVYYMPGAGIPERAFNSVDLSHEKVMQIPVPLNEP